jgi:DNA primase
MKFPPEFLDEIRARVPVSEVVGQRVKLKRTGREWAGLSPFNAEKTPSFTVNDQKGFYHDFSSNKHGDGFDFLMETEGLSFPEAVERLAGMAGLPMPVHSRESQEQEKKRASLHEVMALAAQFFESALQEKIGAKARGYLADRGLDAGVQREFSLGYAPPRSGRQRSQRAGHDRRRVADPWRGHQRPL